MTDFSKSYSSRWAVYKVNNRTWEDAEPTGSFMSASIERSVGQLLESGKFTVDMDSEFSEGYYRLVLYATQDGATERHDVATLLCMSAGDTSDRKSTVLDIVGQSVLYPASVRRVMPCTYVRAGSDGCEFAAKMLRESISAPVSAVGSFAVSSDIVFDINATYMDCITQVLESGGFYVSIDGRGNVSVRSLPDKASGSIKPTHLMPETSGDMDTSSVPNRYVAMENGELAVAVNESPSSEVSTVSRGYVRDPDDGIDQSPIRVGSETLKEYCERRLKELSVLLVTRSYVREYDDVTRPMDLVNGPLGTDYENVTVRIQNQSLECGNGIVISERGAMEVSLW